jgi:hypothetical protein
VGIIAPAEALGWIRIWPVGAEVDAKARVLRRHGVCKRLHVLSAAEHVPSQWIEAVCVDKDQPEPAQQIRILERCQRRIRLGHKERIGRRQSGNELRIDSEIVGLDVTRPAGPSVALECLVQKELAALGRHPRKIGNPRRGRGIEPERRGRVVDETDLTVPESREKRGRARQHEPVHGTLPCPDHERPIRVEVGEGRRP